MVSPLWPSTTRPGSTPAESHSTRLTSRPVRDPGWVCTVTGTSVWWWAAATARITRSTPGVMPSSSMAHLSMPALTPVPAMPSVMSPTNISTIGSGTSAPTASFSAGPRWRKKNGTLS